MTDQPPALRAWHAVVAAREAALLDDLLDDDVVFRSPAVFTAQRGKALTTHYLASALAVLGPTLRYVGEWHDETSAVLEFEAELDGVYVHGMDMLRWNAGGKLVSFTVMVRPLRGLQKLMELMAAQLAQLTAAQVLALSALAEGRPLTVRELNRAVTDLGMHLEESYVTGMLSVLCGLGLAELTPARELGKYRPTERGRDWLAVHTAAGHTAGAHTAGERTGNGAG
jgi:hypothetical protein